MVPSRVNEPLSCPGSGGSRDSAKGSARGGTGARRPWLQTLLRGPRRGAGPGAREGRPSARGAHCVILILRHRRVPGTPAARPCSAPWRPPTLMGPKGTRASLPATSGPLITSAAQCQHLAGGHAPGGRLGPGAKAAGTPSGCGLPDPPLRAAPALSATWPPPPVLRPRGARRRPGASRANPRDHSGAPNLQRWPHTLGSVGGRRPLPSLGSPRTSCSRGDAAAAGGGSAGAGAWGPAVRPAAAAGIRGHAR